MIARIIIFIIAGVRPILGPAVCKFDEPCYYFAIRQFEQHSLIRACWAITLRLLACSPFKRK